MWRTLPTVLVWFSHSLDLRTCKDGGVQEKSKSYNFVGFHPCRRATHLLHLFKKIRIPFRGLSWHRPFEAEVHDGLPQLEMMTLIPVDCQTDGSGQARPIAIYISHSLRIWTCVLHLSGGSNFAVQVLRRLCSTKEGSSPPLPFSIHRKEEIPAWVCIDRCSRH